MAATTSCRAARSLSSPLSLPRLTTSFHPPSLYKNSCCPSTTVASIRQISSLQSFSTISRRVITRPSLTTRPSSPLRSFSSSAPSSFRQTPVNMVVHNLLNRGDYQNAINPSEVSAVTNTANPLVVIDCFATWCGPCKAISPKLVEYSESVHNKNVAFYKVDVDEVPDVAQELGVTAMPTFFFYKDGQKVDQVMGANPPAIEAAIRKHNA